MSNYRHGRSKLYYSIWAWCFAMGTTLTGVGVVSAADAANGETQLAEYVVTANRYLQPLKDANEDVSIVTRKQIETMHMTNLEEALRTVPGVQFLNYGGNGLNANLSGIRINGSKNIVVLVDGIRISDFQGPGASGYMYAALLNNMDNIQSIEVLRGGAGVKYGSGAEGGVINIITRKINKNKSKVTIQGSDRGYSYFLNQMGVEGNTSYHLYYNRTQQGDYVSPDGQEWNSKLDTISKGAVLKHSFGKNNTQDVTVSYDVLNSDFGGRDPIYFNNYSGIYNTKRLTLTHHWNINEHLDNRFTFRNTIEDASYTQLADDPNKNFNTASKNIYHFFNNQLTFHDEYNDTVLGLSYVDDKTDGSVYDEEEEYFTNVKRKMSSKSAFIQQDWHVLPKITLSGGLRYEKPSGDAFAQEMKAHVTKSYKVAFDATPKDTVYYGHSDFYILPSIMQLQDPTYGNAELEPAQGSTKTVGYSHQINDRSYWTWNWFETKQDKGIGLTQNGQYTNYENGISRGWNAQYQAKLGQYWNVNLGWSHLYQYAPGDNYSLGYSPKDMATFSVLYDRKIWSIGMDGFYFIRRVFPGKEQGWPSNRYGVYNLSMNYTPVPEMSMFMKVENIFNAVWAEHTNAIWGGNPGSWYTMPGRTISVGSSASF